MATENHSPRNLESSSADDLFGNMMAKMNRLDALLRAMEPLAEDCGALSELIRSANTAAWDAGEFMLSYHEHATSERCEPCGHQAVLEFPVVDFTSLAEVVGIAS